MTHYAFGDPLAPFNVYVEKAPPSHELWGDTPPVTSTTPLKPGEIDALGKLGGNGWRKVFNVYAKLMFAFPDGAALKPQGFNKWQDYRDKKLLQSQSGTSLTFGHADMNQQAQRGGIHIIAGRTHATRLGISGQCIWLDNEFARHPDLPVIICPYFDYRQLSNHKIERLVSLIGIYPQAT